ncbi:MAG: ABC transporter ATP-binding protein [Acetobacteraceae bacterium]
MQPRFLICDEPVSSLDVSVRAQILNLLSDLQEGLGLSYLYISHDMASVRSVSHRVAVMYLGRIVEIAPATALFERPLHHYTSALLAAIPVPDPDAPGARSLLTGEPPTATNPPPGCHFHPRCPAALPQCRSVVPPLADAGPGRQVACHNPC